VNLPVVYLMDLEDSGKPLPTDAYRWPQAQAHLMAQSVGGLKLLTIATGFDKDFDDLHPKRLRRHPSWGRCIRQLHAADPGRSREGAGGARRRPKGEDWALVWTVEDLVSTARKR
jgi:hypothetical protein